MKVDVYGYQLELVRENGAWIAYRLDTGKRIRVPELGIPANLEPNEIPVFLDDLYHEMARPGQSIRVLAEGGGGDA